MESDIVKLISRKRPDILFKILSEENNNPNLKMTTKVYIDYTTKNSKLKGGKDDAR